MTFNKLAATLGIVGALGGVAQTSAAASMEYEFDFSSNTLAFMTFLGDDTRKIVFPNMGKYDFTVTHSTDGSLNGLQGSITTAGYSVGMISTLGALEYAPLTGEGVFSIDDGMDTLTAKLTFTDIISIKSTIGLSFTSAVNISDFSYSGANAGLKRVAASAMVTADPSPIVSLSAQFTPARSLTDLMKQGSEKSTSYSGSFYSSAPIPEPSTYAMLAVGLGMVGFSLARSRRV